MISAIKPTARESYDRNWKLEKDEENRFVERLNNAERRKRRWDDVHANQEHAVANAPFSFDSPAFNIITGSTNYILQELTAEMREEEAIQTAQLELFGDKRMRRA